MHLTEVLRNWILQGLLRCERYALFSNLFPFWSENILIMAKYKAFTAPKESVQDRKCGIILMNIFLCSESYFLHVANCLYKILHFRNVSFPFQTTLPEALRNHQALTSGSLSCSLDFGPDLFYGVGQSQVKGSFLRSPGWKGFPHCNTNPKAGSSAGRTCLGDTILIPSYLKTTKVNRTNSNYSSGSVTERVIRIRLCICHGNDVKSGHSKGLRCFKEVFS